MVLRARDIMETKLLTVDVELDALECARRMVAARRGYAIATRGGPATISGIVTEWDFLERVLFVGRDPVTTRIDEIASRPVRSVEVTAATMEVVEAMARSGIRRMVVTEGERTVGVVSAKDVFRAFRSYVDKVSNDIARLHSMSL